MNVMIFVTDDGGPNGTGPTLYMADTPHAALPPHPRSLSWRYLATVPENDGILSFAGQHVRDVIEADGHCILTEIAPGLR